MKVLNEYATVLDYNKIPKSVVAAVAVSLICRLEGCEPDEGAIVRDVFLQEWRSLHANGIVPQPPNRETL